ncbi:MAG: undecaprenyl/decaprenyl-phosphate alpha-N-acetylglucosaminyl 1-phosphate transferase [Armatimonadetes bacterium]|nr:undecaprenyl/decaprenyl-phosphate alpha-N-acetylglucosaminyl 1-phosphate transferase [Armatimonadota bacterium]
MRQPASVLLTLPVACLLTWLMIVLSHRYGWLVQPRADRWHRRPTALFGGVAIFFTTLLAAGFLAQKWGFGGRLDLLGLLAGATVIFLVGWLDDVRPLNPQVKLVGQMTAITPFLMGMGLQRMSEGFMFAIPLMFIWMLALSNSFNLLDNMDGLCAGVAAVVACVLAGRAMYFDDVDMAGMASIVGLTCLGFLCFNFPFGRRSASIFMGDCGSMFLGYVLAGLVTTAFWGNVRGVPEMAFLPPLIMAVPIFDTALVIVRRRREGRAISQGGRDHSSHRLVYAGLSERMAVLTLMGLSALFGTAAVLVERSGPTPWMGATAALGAAFMLSLGVWLSRFTGPRVPLHLVNEPGRQSQATGAA